MDILEIKNYIEKNIGSSIWSSKEYQKERDKFLKEYPLERFKKISLDEYAGNKKSGDSKYFCNDLEQSYRDLYTPISVYSSWYGIYKNEKGNYVTNKNTTITNKRYAEVFWEELRIDIVQLLEYIISGQIEKVKDFNLNKLTSMPQVLLKLAMIYKPENVLQIVKNEIIREIYADIFGNDNTNIYYKSMRIKMEFINKEFPKYDHVKVSGLIYQLYYEKKYTKNVKYYSNIMLKVQEKDGTVASLQDLGIKYAKDIKESAKNLKVKISKLCDDIIKEAKYKTSLSQELCKYVNAQLRSSNEIIDEDANEIEDLNEELMNYVGKNTIIYGVPGCGKSRKVVDLLKGEEYVRVLFHPEYTYSDFIGQVMPVVKDEKITYEFVPGPFTKILEEAIKTNESSPSNFFLVIEEINRGNAPAIFGDVFQLLDRNKDGVSEYKINNKDIAKHIFNDEDKKIYIPSNLTIFATMNTCDQNVFTMDTAFKRRWRMERIENNFESAEISNCEIDGLSIQWGEFATIVNDLILNLNDGFNSEDKQLGVYFVKEDEIRDIKAFAEKVLMYLWDDVVKYDKTQLFKPEYKTLDSLINAFVKGENVFKSDVMEGLYNRSKNVKTEEI